jgi:diadenylate cyclase
VQQALWLLSRLTPLALLDILLVALIIYGLLMLIRGTQADQLVRGVLFLLFASSVVSYFFNLTIFSWLLQNIIPALLIAIPVIFQPELRRVLEQLGRTGSLIQNPLQLHIASYGEKVADEISRASALLAERGYGGLVVVERSTGLEEYVHTGTRIDGTVTAELLLQIFYKGSPLHDGAVIIRGERIIAARCLLPLSEESGLDPELGTRHRAAIGITESTDAICVVVSEESGAISLANHGHLVRSLNEQTLKRLLAALFRTQASPVSMPRLPSLSGLPALFGYDRGGAAANGAGARNDGRPAPTEVEAADSTSDGPAERTNGRARLRGGLGRIFSQALRPGR